MQKDPKWNWRGQNNKKSESRINWIWENLNGQSGLKEYKPVVKTIVQSDLIAPYELRRRSTKRFDKISRQKVGSSRSI